MHLHTTELAGLLPGSQKKYNWQGVEFDLYIAKDFGVDNWRSAELKQLVLNCRQAFERYGEISLEDDLDKKSAVLLVRARYSEAGKQMEEWFSMRFVQANGHPFLTEDLLVKFKDGKNLFEIIKNKYYTTDQEAANNIFTISRFCGTAPYNTDDLSGENNFKRRFTALAFYLMALLALENVFEKEKIFHITAMFHNSIFERLRIFHWKDLKHSFDFDFVHEVLEIPQEYMIDFSPGPVALRYPTYFFHLSKLVAWIKKAIEEKKISHHTVNHYLQKEVDMNDVEISLENNRIKGVKSLSNLGLIFTGSDKLVHSEYTGDELGKELEQEVEKTLVLNIFTSVGLRNKINEFLEKLNFFV